MPIMSRLLLSVACGLSPGVARGTETAAPRPPIDLHFIADWDPAFQADVRDELAAQLSRDGLAIQSFDPTAAPAAWATIEVRMNLDTSWTVTLDVRDRLTQKSVRRTLDLSHSHPNARSLELAIAASELLHASWAEFALSDPRAEKGGTSASGPPDEPPVAVAASLARRGLSARRVARNELSFSGFTRGTPSGIQLFGGGIDDVVRPWRRFGFGLGISGAGLLPLVSTHGRVVGGSLHGRVAFHVVAIERAKFRCDVIVAVHPGVLWTSGRPDADATAARSANFTMDAMVGVRPSVRAGPVWLFYFASVGGVLGSVHVRDDTAIVASYAGFLYEAGLGIRVPMGAP